MDGGGDAGGGGDVGGEEAGAGGREFLDEGCAAGGVEVEDGDVGAGGDEGVDGGAAEAGGAGWGGRSVLEVGDVDGWYAPTGDDECSSFNLHVCRIGSSRKAVQQVRVWGDKTMWRAEVSTSLSIRERIDPVKSPRPYHK